MKQLFQSTFVLLAIALMAVLQLINTCQFGRVKSELVRTREKLDALVQSGVAMPEGPRSQGSAESQRQADKQAEPANEQALPAEEAEALADPANLLKPHPAPRTDPKKIVKGGTLRWQWNTEPDSLNPYIAMNADTAQYLRLVSSRLAYRHPENPDVWSPELAIKVTTPDQGKTFEVTLRQGVMWQAPAVDFASGRYDWLKGDHELTSDDYLFVFEMLQNSQVTGRISQLRSQMQIERVEALDRHRFRVTFKERLFNNQSALLDLEPLPRWLYLYDEDGSKFDDATWGLKLNEHWYNLKAIGVGEYRFVSWEPGTKITLERNERFWGPRPNFDRQIILFIRDGNAWLSKLKTGELDFTQLRPEQYKTEILDKGAGGPLLGQPGIKMKRHGQLGYFFIGWNQDTKYFSDKRVRQAMTMALNRPGILESVILGLGNLTTGPFSTTSACYDHSIQPWPFDLKQAAAKLEEAGWVDRNGDGIREKTIGGEVVPFEFTLLLFGNSSEYATIANIYREDLLSIGVKMNPSALEWATMYKKMDERAFDAVTGAVALSWDVDLKPHFGSKEADMPKSGNRIGFRNPEADALMDALNREFDPKQRVAICHKLHRLIHDEQPLTFTYERELPVLYWDYMNDLVFSLFVPYRDTRYFSFNQVRP